MSEYIMAATIKRGSATIAGPCMVQLDKMQAGEAIDYGGANPHFTYRMYTAQLSIGDVQLLRQGDQVVDPVVIDPKTQTNRTFLIISDPEPHLLSMSWQWVAERQTRGGS